MFHLLLLRNSTHAYLQASEGGKKKEKLMKYANTKDVLKLTCWGKIVSVYICCALMNS